MGSERISPDHGDCLDLFGRVSDAGRYPAGPGFKSGDTSQAAAARITGHASKLRKAVLQEFLCAGDAGLSADQCARNVGANVLAIRPRVSELRADGLIVPTDRLARNESGLSARIWRASELAHSDGRA